MRLRDTQFSRGFQWPCAVATFMGIFAGVTRQFSLAAISDPDLRRRIGRWFARQILAEHATRIPMSRGSEWSYAPLPELYHDLSIGVDPSVAQTRTDQHLVVGFDRFLGVSEARQSLLDAARRKSLDRRPRVRLITSR